MSKKSFTEGSWKKSAEMRVLLRAFLSCNNEGELGEFLRDIATLAELKALSERLAIARLLAAGKTYLQIRAAFGASTTTITRVAEFLESGNGGYKLVLGRLTGKHHPKLSRGEKMVSAQRR